MENIANANETRDENEKWRQKDVKKCTSAVIR